MPGRTKAELARRILERALGAGVPASRVTGEKVYGGDRRLRTLLKQRGQPFVLAINGTEPL
jgi:SRSO17 transposase